VSINVVEFDIPFVVFFGDAVDAAYAKTALGLVEWRTDACAGQMRLPDVVSTPGVPDLSLAEAKKAGGAQPHHRISRCRRRNSGSLDRRLREVASAGIDIIAGLHVRLASFPGLEEAATAGGARLVDVRVPPKLLPVGTGRKRPGKRLLTVGTDCVVGKKYTALAIDRENASSRNE